MGDTHLAVGRSIQKHPSLTLDMSFARLGAVQSYRVEICLLPLLPVWCSPSDSRECFKYSQINRKNKAANNCEHIVPRCVLMHDHLAILL